MLAMACHASWARADLFSPLPTSNDYDSWLTVCDNTLSCEAKGLMDGENEAPDLRIDRDGGPDEQASITLSVPFQAALSGLSLDGTPLRTDASLWDVHYDSDQDFTTLSTEDQNEVASVITQLLAAKTLQVGGSVITVPLDGLPQALARMDTVQGRAGGVTALVSKGNAPASAVPAAPAVPKVPSHVVDSTLAADETKTLVTRAEAFAKTISQSKDCDDQPATPADADAYPLSTTQALVFIPCFMGAYQGTSLAFIVPRQADQPPSPLQPPSPFGGTYSVAELTDPDFDPSTATLTTLVKGRGLTDCGFSAQWIWENDQFVLSSAATQDLCGGSQPGDWPTLYRSDDPNAKDNP